MEIEDDPSSENIIVPERLVISMDKDTIAKEYFGFEPKRFSDDCYNTLADYGATALEDIEAALKKKYTSEADLKKISESMSKATQLFQRAMDTSFDAFELYLPQNVFFLPKDFKGLNKKEQIREEKIEDDKVSVEIARMRSELNKERKLHLNLKAENASLRKELELFEKNRYTFESLDKFCTEAHEGGNIKELVSTLLSESTKLNETLNLANELERSDRKPRGEELRSFAQKLE